MSRDRGRRRGGARSRPRSSRRGRGRGRDRRGVAADERARLEETLPRAPRGSGAGDREGGAVRTRRGPRRADRRDACGDVPERLRGEAVRRTHPTAAPGDRLRRRGRRRRDRVQAMRPAGAVVRRGDRIATQRGRALPRRQRGVDPRKGPPRSRDASHRRGVRRADRFRLLARRADDRLPGKVD